jgi:hypothetical protein
MKESKKVDLEELFPAAEVSCRKERLKRFWHGELLDRPVIRPMSWANRYTQRRSTNEAVTRFVATLQIESARGFDVIPAFACALGAAALASAFGGAVKWNDNDDIPPWIEPIIRNNPEDVYTIELPAPDAGLIGEAIRQYQAARNAIEGYIPPRVPDMQGPLNTASLIWNQEDFLTAMYTNPDEVHHLLNLVTDYIIAVYRYFKSTWRDTELLAWPCYYMPPELGVGMTEYLIPLMQPSLWEEFGLPYVNRIADAFGGVYIHCCGTFNPHWNLVKKIHNLRGMDTMYPNSHPAQLHAAFPQIVHNMGLSAQGKASLFPADNGEDDFIAFYLAHAPRNMRIQFLVGADDPEQFERQVKLILRKWKLPETT